MSNLSRNGILGCKVDFTSDGMIHGWLLVAVGEQLHVCGFKMKRLIFMGLCAWDSLHVGV